MDPFRTDQEVWTEKLDADNQKELQQPWHFAYASEMKACGPEFGHVGCFKYASEGQRTIMAVPYDKLLDFHARVSTEGAVATISKLSNLFAEMEAATAKEFAKTCTILKASCGPGSLVFLPPGWCIAEKQDNSSETVGLRWLARPTKESWDAFKAMAKLQSPMGVEPNEKTALLVQVRAVGLEQWG